jgi:nucleotide-binding universal stress UspA family protein
MMITPAGHDGDLDRAVNPLGRVVVGLDGSQPAEAALRWAAQQIPAGLGGASLHLVHGFSPSAAFLAGAFQQDSRSHHREIEELLTGPWAAAATSAGWEPSVHPIDDDPADAIVAVADQVEADAIVVGIHGDGDHRPHLVGSVTRKLLRHSARPVIVIDPSWDEAPAGEQERASTGTVLACAGYGKATTQAMEWAASFASITGRSLELLHAVSDRPLYPLDSPIDVLGSYLGPGVDLAWATEDVRVARDELAGRWPDLAITATVVQGSVVGSILDASERADLVVVGKPHDAPFYRATISPRLYQLLARSTRSTALVPSCEATT